MSTQGRNQTIDLVKYIASLMVVAIHTGLFSDKHETVSFVVVHIICRLAVPFFAVCTGYFMGPRFLPGKDPAAANKCALSFWHYWKKQIVLYAVWTVVYLFISIPRWIEIGWFSPWAFVDYLIAACTKGAYYHLWYLWGILFALPIFYVILRKLPRKFWPGLVAALWILKICEYAYSAYLPTGFLGFVPVLDRIEALLCLLPLLLVGAFISQQERKPAWIYFAGFGVNLVLLATEAFALRNYGHTAVSYIFFTLPTAFFFFRGVLQIRINYGAKLFSSLAEVSTFVYCIHPMFLNLTDKFALSSTSKFLICTICATASGFSYLVLRSKLARKKVISCFS